MLENRSLNVVSCRISRLHAIIDRSKQRVDCCKIKVKELELEIIFLQSRTFIQASCYWDDSEMLIHYENMQKKVEAI